MPANQTGRVKIAPFWKYFQAWILLENDLQQKGKLAKSGVFVSENLTKRCCHLLNTPRSTSDPRSVWSDHGKVLAQVPMKLV